MCLYILFVSGFEGAYDFTFLYDGIGKHVPYFCAIGKLKENPLFEPYLKVISEWNSCVCGQLENIRLC